MRVVLISLVRRGGMAHYHSQLANALSSHVSTAVIVPEGVPDHYFVPSVERTTIPTGSGPRDTALGTLNPATYARLRHALLGLQRDVVHVTAPHPWNPALGLWAGHPLLCTLHDPQFHAGENVLSAWTERIFRRQVDGFFVHGDAARGELSRQGVPAEKLHVVLHGDYEFFTRWLDPKIQEENVFLFFGRIEPYKGLDALLHIAPRLLAELPGWKLVVAGKGDLSRHELLRRGPLLETGRIEVLNRYLEDAEVAPVFQRAKIVVLPYRSASQSGIIPIASAFGKPVVATNVGSLGEVVDDGETGRLVPPGDEKALLRALVALATDEPSRRTMGQKALVKMRQSLRWDDIAGMHVQVYRQYVGEGSAPRETRSAPGVERSTPRPRVVHVLNTAALGGGAKQVGALIEGIPEVEPALVCFEAGPLVDRLRTRGVPCEVVDVGRSRLPGPGLRRLVTALRRFSPDIVHCHGTRAAFFVACIRPWLRGVHLIYTERGLAYQRHALRARRTWGRAVEALNGRGFERTVCVSQGDLEWAFSTGIFQRERTTCIRDGIDLAEAAAFSKPGARAEARRSLDLPDDAEVVLTIGRLEAEKAPLDLVDAFAQVHARRPRAHLVWIGGGRLESQALARARERSVAPACHFVGSRPDAAALLPACDVFALASLWEGLPSVLLEALLAERPCVATAVNGVPEVLLDGVTGCTVPARDPAALGAALAEMLERPDWARGLARAGAAHVRANFDMRATCAGYRDLYGQVAGRAGRVQH